MCHHCFLQAKLLLHSYLVTFSQFENSSKICSSLLEEGFLFFCFPLHSKVKSDLVNGVSKLQNSVNVCKLLPFYVCISCVFLPLFLVMNSSQMWPWRDRKYGGPESSICCNLRKHNRQIKIHINKSVLLCCTCMRHALLWCFSYMLSSVAVWWAFRAAINKCFN